MFHKILIVMLVLIMGGFLFSEKKRFDRAEKSKNFQLYSLISNSKVVGHYYLDENGDTVWL